MSRTCQVAAGLAALALLAMFGAVAGTIAAEMPSPAQARQGSLATVSDFGAVGDGKADDTAALQKAASSGVGDLRLPRGTYRITRPIVIDLDKVGWTSVLGSGTARIVMAGPGPALRFLGTHDGTAAPESVKPNVWQQQRMPTVDGIEIVGAHEQAVGIEAVGTMKLIVTRVVVREALHGIHLKTRNRNVIISNCHLYKNRGVGLFLDDVNLHQINVTGCHISCNAAGGIVVRAGNVRNLQVSGCDIEGNTVNVLIDSAGSKYGIAEVAVVGCTLQHAGGPDSANVRFIGASAEGTRTWGHLTIADNVLSDVETNIDIQKACEVSIVGNTVWTGYKYSLRIEDSSNVVVGPNMFARNPRYRDREKADDAILIRNCQDVTLTGLHIHAVLRSEAGLVLENCRRCNLTNCSILDCTAAGLLMRNVSQSRVSDCLIRNDLPNRGPWLPLKIVGGKGNMVVDNLLGGPFEVDPRCARASGNVTQP